MSSNNKHCHGTHTTVICSIFFSFFCAKVWYFGWMFPVLHSHVRSTCTGYVVGSSFAGSCTHTRTYTLANSLC